MFLYAGLGLLQPLFPLYLTSRGMSAHAATFVLALGPLASVVVPPAVGLIADAYHARAAILRGTTLLCSLVVLVYLRAAPAGTALIAMSLAFAVVRAPIPTLVDAAAYAIGERSLRYGQLRLFGSLGFVVAVFGGGTLVDAWGWEPLLAATAGAYALTSVAALGLRRDVIARSAGTRVSWLRLLYERRLWMLLAVVAMSQVASGAYDACYALHLRQLGHGEQFVGFAWAIAVLAEVAVLAVSARLIDKFGAQRLLVFAFATSVVRWLLVAITHSAVAIVGLQLLHGITYPLYWVPAVVLVHRMAPRDLQTAAQGLLAAAAGVGSAVGMVLAGVVFDSVGAPSVFACASVASLVAVVAAVSLHVVRVEKCK